MLSASGREEASTRYRLYQFLPALKARGHEARASAFYPLLPSPSRGSFRRVRDWVSGYCRQISRCLTSGRFDLVVVHRSICPYVLNEIARVIRTPIVYDFDDALWLQKRPAWIPFADKKPWELFCSRADLILAGNPFLAEHAAKLNRNVRVLPTVVDTDVFAPGRSAPREIPLIGWVGSPMTFRFLEPVLPLLDELGRERRFRVRVVGSEQSVSLKNVVVEQPAWSEEAESALFTDLDIGIYPLQDDDWGRGKCGLKSIQYMAAGVAHVVSPVGVVREICADGESALWAKDARDWAQHLTRLLDDPGLRARLALNGRRQIESTFSLSRWANQFVDLLESAL